MEKSTPPSSRTSRMADISQDSIFAADGQIILLAVVGDQRSDLHDLNGLGAVGDDRRCTRPAQTGNLAGLRTTPTTLPLGPTFFMASQPHSTPDLPLAPRIRTLSPSWGSCEPEQGAGHVQSGQSQARTYPRASWHTEPDSNRIALPRCPHGRYPCGWPGSLSMPRQGHGQGHQGDDLVALLRVSRASSFRSSPM